MVLLVRRRGCSRLCSKLWSRGAGECGLDGSFFDKLIFKNKENNFDPKLNSTYFIYLFLGFYSELNNTVVLITEK